MILKKKGETIVSPFFFVHMLAITAMMLCQLLFRAAGTAGRLRRAAALVLDEAAAFMAVRGTVG